MKLSRVALLLLAASFIPMCASTLAKSDKKPAKNKKDKIKDKDKTVTISKGQFEDHPSGPCQMDVFEKELLTETVKATDILSNANEYKDKSQKRFPNRVLGYVTPWNNHGYDTAKWFNHKVDMVAPVWLQLLPKSFENKKDFSIGGLHDVDEGWIKDVEGEEKRTSILPRLLFDKWQREDWIAFINNVS